MEFPCMKIKFSCMEMRMDFMVENLIHVVVYTPATQERFRGEEIVPYEIFVFMHGNIIFMHEISLLCMKILNLHA